MQRNTCANTMWNWEPIKFLVNGFLPGPLNVLPIWSLSLHLRAYQPVSCLERNFLCLIIPAIQGPQKHSNPGCPRKDQQLDRKATTVAFFVAVTLINFHESFMLCEQWPSAPRCARSLLLWFWNVLNKSGSVWFCLVVRPEVRAAESGVKGVAAETLKLGLLTVLQSLLWAHPNRFTRQEWTTSADHQPKQVPANNLDKATP